MPAHKVVSAAQERILLKLMQENPDIANGRANSKAPLAKQAVTAFWHSVASHLNAMGSGTKKPALKWRDYWTERKYSVRRKIGKLRAYAAGTSGANPTKLTEVDKRIFNIMRPAAVYVKPAVQKKPPTSPEVVPSPSPTASPPSSPLPTAPSPPLQPQDTQATPVNTIQQHSESQLTDYTMGDIENRRLEIENRQLVVQERLVAAVERLATVAEAKATNAEMQTDLLRLLLAEVRQKL